MSLKQGADIQEQLPLLIQKPRLWNGCEDPFMYQVSISLHKDGKQIDSVTVSYTHLHGTEKGKYVVAGFTVRHATHGADLCSMKAATSSAKRKLNNTST